MMPIISNNGFATAVVQVNIISIISITALEVVIFVIKIMMPTWNGTIKLLYKTAANVLYVDTIRTLS